MNIVSELTAYRYPLKSPKIRDMVLSMTPDEFWGNTKEFIKSGYGGLLSEFSALRRKNGLKNTPEYIGSRKRKVD